MPLDIEVRGARELNRKLDALARDLGHPRPIFKAAVVETMRWCDRNFQQDGALAMPGGWAPFKPQRVAGELQRGRWVGRGKSRRFDTSAKLLRDTGRLRGSIRGFSSDRGGKVFTQLPYAIVHHHGAKGHGLPSRPIIPYTYQVAPLILQKAKEWVSRVLAERRLKGVF